MNYFVVSLSISSPLKYASPELLRHESVDSRSDIYSLGLLLKDILGTRYSRIIKRCTEQNRDDRYADVDQVIKAISHRYRPVYAALAVACLVFLIWMAGNVVDEISEFREFKTAEKERQELCDSVYAAIDSQVHAIYAGLEERLKSIPYMEFEFQEMATAMKRLPAIWDSFQNATSDQQLISGFVSYYTTIQQQYYERVIKNIGTKPNI